MMTPCEKLGYKVGDRFEVVTQSESEAQVGWVVVLYEDDAAKCPLFYKVGEEFGRTYCPKLTEIRPLKTEAEKRGAKFGTMGVIKATGDKGVFWKSSSSYLGEEWYLFMNDGNILVIPSTQIRLDHEPEYKEIPFSEATHEQRMEKDCVEWRGHTVSEIVPFKNGSYGWTIGGKPDIMWNTDGLTVRIPT